MTGVEPMTSVTPMKLRRREDVVTDGGYPEKIVANHIYMEGVVAPDQDIVSRRLRRFIEHEFYNVPLDGPHGGKVDVDFQDQDLIDETAEANVVALLVKNCVITLNEGRTRLGEDRNPAFKDMTYMEFLIDLGLAPTAVAGQGMGIPGGLNTGANTNPNMPSRAAQAPGEPQRGRPAKPGNVNNPADNVNSRKGVSKSLFEFDFEADQIPSIGDLDSVDVGRWAIYFNQQLEEQKEEIDVVKDLLRKSK